MTAAQIASGDNRIESGKQQAHSTSNRIAGFASNISTIWAKKPYGVIQSVTYPSDPLAPRAL
jgi:hypothetical protein